jgi:lysophospholipase L1-like esterase
VLYTLLTQRYTGQTIELYDRGVGGERVQGGTGGVPGVVRLPLELDATAPQVLLLLEGVNDLNADGSRAIPTVIGGLRSMIQQARARNIVVFLGTLLPERPTGRNGSAAAIIPAANVQIRTLAASEGVTLVDLYEAFGGSPDPWIDADGLHPNAAGYRKMAETFFPPIRTRFELPLASASTWRW